MWTQNVPQLTFSLSEVKRKKKRRSHPKERFSKYFKIQIDCLRGIQVQKEIQNFASKSKFEILKKR